MWSHVCFSPSLVGQAQQQFQMGNEQFEDAALGSQRPTELIRRYGELYLDSRVEALDALDGLAPLKGLDVLKLKILFSVIVVCRNNNNSNCIERCNLRFLQSPQCAANCLQHARSSGPGRNRAQIMCNTSSDYHVQHALRHLVGRDSSAVKFDRVEIAFILAF